MKESINDLFVEECRKVPPDFLKISQLLEQGADINAMGECNPIVCEILLGYGNVFIDDNHDAAYIMNTTEYLPQIVDFLIEEGLDTFKYALECISCLVYSSASKECFYTAKKLLAYVAEETNENFEKTLEIIGMEESFQRCCEHNTALENLYYAMYEAVEAVKNGKSCEGINVYHDAVGMIIEKIVYFSTSNDCVQMSEGVNYNADIGFVSGEKVLLLKNGVNILFNNDALKEIEYVECNDLFGISVAGHEITDISFDSRVVCREKTQYNQPQIFLKLSNNHTIKFTHDFGETNKNKAQSRFEVM